jgi:DNA polymerase-4
VTDPKVPFESATDIARAVKRRIVEETQLTASAGVSVNKFVAKVASGMNKPDGLTVVRPDQVGTFIARLPIEEFFGVGRVTAAKFKKLGVHSGADLLALTEDELVARFGRVGRYYYNAVRGIDNRPVRSSRRRKSIGAEQTFFEDIHQHEALERKLEKIVERVSKRMTSTQARARTVTLKIKYHDFVVTTRSHTLEDSFDDQASLDRIVRHLLQNPDWPERPVRLLGVSVSGLWFASDAEPLQLGLELW